VTDKPLSAKGGIFEPFAVDDVIVYTDSGRVGVRLTGEGYRKSATLGYWEGEDG